MAKNEPNYKPKYKPEVSDYGRKYVSRDVPYFPSIPNGASFLERPTSAIISFHVIPRNP